MTIGNGPDDGIGALGDSLLWEVLAMARLWPATAMDEAKQQLRQLQKKRKTNSGDDMIDDCDEVLAAIAAVDAADKRPLLIGKLAALKLPGGHEEVHRNRSGSAAPDGTQGKTTSQTTRAARGTEPRSTECARPSAAPDTLL